MKRTALLLAALLLLALALTACGGGQLSKPPTATPRPEPSPTVKAAAPAATAAPAGEKEGGVDKEKAAEIIQSAGCGGCHTIAGVEGAQGQVGPDLSHIGAEAAGRKSGMSAEDYIRESIVDPNAFIAPKCPTGDCAKGIMPNSFGQQLKPDDLDMLVKFLASLK